jgi:hypothetical protein
MPQTRGKPVSIVEAARLIYRTRAPSERQIRRVYERMKAGVLEVHRASGEPATWTTTEQSLADYLAARMVRRRPASAAARPREPGAAGSSHPRAKELREATRLRRVYRGMWREYFLAVLLRRRVAGRSVAFRRAVIAGQAAILACLLGVCAATVRFTFEPIARERAAIERWIEANTDRYKVTCWHPSRAAPEGDAVLVEVEYQYASGSPRTIHTRRTFRVVGDEVREVEAD